MYALLRYFWAMCLLRKNPQDIPYSLLLLLLFLLVELALETVQFNLALTTRTDSQGSEINPFQVVLVINAVSVFALFLICWVVGHRNRFVQTYTALLGVDILFSSIFLAIFSVVISMPASWPLVSPLLLLRVGWQLAVNAHIMRHTLSTGFMTGWFVALILMLISEITFQGLVHGLE